ncbi:MAG: BMC domain-containing protein [Lachnospiraceae bacterium]|nr:BMC domain-containing protein [Lachnospiraceae bacterium]
MLSWGFLEVIGYVPAVAGGDAMVKAANVELVGMEVIGGGMVTVAVRGEVGAVRTAVDAGAEAAKKAGKLHCANVIARPSKDAQKVLTLAMTEGEEG